MSRVRFNPVQVLLRPLIALDLGCIGVVPGIGELAYRRLGAVNVLHTISTPKT
jgi:hypothetical protein